MFRRRTSLPWLFIEAPVLAAVTGWIGCQSGSLDDGAGRLAATGVDAGGPDGAPPSPPTGLLCAAPIEVLDCYVQGGYEVNTYTPGELPELHLIGINTPEVPGGGGIDTHVHVAAGSMVLALSALLRTHWTITADPGAVVEHVILVGGEVQTADVPPGTSVESHSYDGGETELPEYCGYTWPPEYEEDCKTPIPGAGKCCTNALIEYIEGLAGRKLTAFAGCYVASEFIVNGCDCAPPTCAAPEPLVVECAGPGGTAASDPALQAWLAQATVAGGCGEVTITNDAPYLFAASCASEPSATPVTFTATDASGQTATCGSTVTVLDTTPPGVVLQPSAACLWPPSHAMASVATVAVSDVCDPDAAATGVAASSDESTSTERGAGGPDKCPDARLVDGVVELRAERAGPSGKDNGRVYGSVRVFASDSCGNAAEAALPVGAAPGCPGAVCVPHDHAPGGACPAVDDGQVDATVCN